MPKILENVRVLDLTHFFAGPFTTMLLSDMGADVIKIEPLWGERIRAYPPLIKGVSPYFAYLNRNKRGMALNLKSEKGVQILKDLVRFSDVVVENFSPGTMNRMGIGYETLKAINPGIILASISGFGQTGPYSPRPSFDIIAQAMSGIMTLTGETVGKPVQVEDYLGDSVAGLYGAIGIVAALYYRKLSGRGQWVDVSQLDSMVSILPSAVFYMHTGDTVPKIRKKFFTGIYGMFEAKDGYVVMGAPVGAIMDRLAEVVGTEKLDYPAVTDWVRTRTVQEVVDKFVENSIPVAPVLAMDKVVTNPQVLARDMIVEVEHPQAGRIKVLGFPIKFSETPGKVEKPPALLGQHNEEILSTLLGYTKEQIAELRKEKVI